jgi:hypothetical protein
LKIYWKRWAQIGGAREVWNGIMPIYISKRKAMRYWFANFSELEYRGPPKKMKIVREMIADALKNGVIVETSIEFLIWINLISLVPKPNGKWRLVVDMREVNRFMRKRHFKMEGIPTLQDLIMEKDYAISYDLKEAYNPVPVHCTNHSTHYWESNSRGSIIIRECLLACRMHPELLLRS